MRGHRIEYKEEVKEQELATSKVSNSYSNLIYAAASLLAIVVVHFSFSYIKKIRTRKAQNNNQFNKEKAEGDEVQHEER